MRIGRIEWKGGMGGYLVVFSNDPICIHGSSELVDYLNENCDSDHCIDFAPEEIEIMGAIALFMAIREQAAYERGHVLKHAVSKVGGVTAMGGYDFLSVLSPVFSVDLSHWDLTESFTDGCRKLANHLQPIQTESQYPLRCAAFEYISSSTKNMATSV